MPSDVLPSNAKTGLESSITRLHATLATPLPFLKGVVVRSFLLERGAGNVLIYNSPGISAAASDITDLGQPSRLLVNHWHEAMFEPPDLDVPIFVHQRDRAQTKLPIAGMLSERECLGDDLEIIPTPGHTAGTTMFLWDNGEHRFLFPGDTIWVQGGEWKAVLLAEGDREAYLASLALVMSLSFAFLVPWGSEEGQPYAYSVSRIEAQDRLEQIVRRLRAGENA